MLTLKLTRNICTLQKPTMLFPSNIEILNHDINVFKPAMKDYLLAHSFYSVETLFSTAI
jgi:hypothetical protein